jgi:hypothetical protein
LDNTIPAIDVVPQQLLKRSNSGITLHTSYWICAIHFENSDFEILGKNSCTYGITAWPKCSALPYPMLYMVF